MKIATALRYANEIHRRVSAINGILATPICDSDAVKIKRIWVFGSIIKGSLNPNDLDILIEMDSQAGRRMTWKQTKIDKQYRRRYGISIPPSAKTYALIWLTKGMKMVSRHCLPDEAIVIDRKVLIYPRNDLDTHFRSVMAQQPTSRIAQEVFDHEGNVVVGEWPSTASMVRRSGADAGVEVKTPEEARTEATRMAEEVNGRVYRGSLPFAWQEALADIPRS